MSGTKPLKRKQNHVSKPCLGVSELSPNSLEPLSKKPKGKSGMTKAPPKPPTQVCTKPLTKAPPKPPTQVCTKPLTKAPPKPPTQVCTKSLTKAPPKPSKVLPKPPTKALSKGPCTPSSQHPTNPLPKSPTKALNKPLAKALPKPPTLSASAKLKSSQKTKLTPKSLHIQAQPSSTRSTLGVGKEKLQKQKTKEAKKQVKSKPRKKSRVCDYNSFRKRARVCFASQAKEESSLWKSIYGDTIPKKACVLRDDLYLRAAEAVLHGDLDAHNVQPLDVLVEQHVQTLPPSEAQASQVVFSELRDQLLKCMDGKLDLPACPVCKTDEFMSSCLIQVRSGDEAMGVFPQCLKCKHIVRKQRR